VAVGAVLFTLNTPVYSTITVVCTTFLYISYVLPIAAGLWAYGRSWRSFGPWQLGGWFRPLAVVSLVGCLTLILVGMQPPNEASLPVVAGMGLLLTAAWFAGVRTRFPGPPVAGLAEGIEP